MKHLGSIVHSLLGGMRQEQATTQRKQIYLGGLARHGGVPLTCRWV